MNTAHIVYHLARADLLERTRRYTFLILLGLAVFLGYQIATNNLTLQLDEYRGIFNSAWAGSLMALMGTFFIGWFGFYLVKGSIAHDRHTGVGQIMAATPMTRLLYLLGKWAGNFAILIVLNLILVVFGLGIQLLAGETTEFNLFTMLAPFVFITLPSMALVAATAVLFESIKFLSGAFGHIVYFFLFIYVADTLDKSHSAYGFDITGMGIMRRSLWAAAEAAYPHFNGGFVIDIQSRLETAEFIFHWSGVDWTFELILQRFALLGIALILILVASIFFDRFEQTDDRPNKIWKFRKDVKLADNVAPTVPATTTAALAPLKPSARKFSFLSLLNLELKLLLNRARWWWFVVAIALVIVGGIAPSGFARAFLLPAAWVWPISIWSGLGSREMNHNVQQLTFSAAYPLRRQLPAQWFAGFLITFGLGFGTFLSMILAGDGPGLFAFAAGALFIPSLALACGVWSKSSKLFEMLYIFIWYFGPINHLLGLDYIGTQGSGRPMVFMTLSLLLVMLAIWGRKRQISR